MMSSTVRVTRLPGHLRIKQLLDVIPQTRSGTTSSQPPISVTPHTDSVLEDSVACRIANKRHRTLVRDHRVLLLSRVLCNVTCASQQIR
jgi:hypothetical protein